MSASPGTPHLPRIGACYVRRNPEPTNGPTSPGIQHGSSLRQPHPDMVAAADLTFSLIYLGGDGGK